MKFLFVLVHLDVVVACVNKHEAGLTIAQHSRASAENFPERPKSSTIKPLSGGGQRKKIPKNSKKDRKIALLSLYLLCLYHVRKSRWRHGPLASQRLRP